MSQNEVKNQHYVPQVYLRRFTGENGKIHVFDKKENRSFETNIRNVASERRFYDSEMLGQITGDKQFLEKQLGNIEGQYDLRCRAIISALDTGNFRKLKPKDRHFLSLYMAVQMFRTKEVRITNEQMAQTMLKLTKQWASASEFELPPDEVILGGYSPAEVARGAQHRALLNIEKLNEVANILYRHIWFIDEAYGGEEFITSDNPFVKRGHLSDEYRSMDGIACEGIEIMFPLSPKYLVTMVDRHGFAHAEPFDGKRKALKCSEHMIYKNQFQIQQSSRFVFSSCGDFSFTKTVLDEEPHNRDPDRRRFETNQDYKLGY